MNHPDTLSTPTGIQKISLKTPLLSSGNSMKCVAEGEDMWMHIKIYAEGGENGLHCHASEEHAFVVLAGEATFFDANGEPTVVGKHCGMLVPKGVLYRFQSSGDEPLALLRIGAGKNPFAGDAADDRWDADGKPFAGTDKANRDGAKPGVPIPGRFFGE